jgi:asparagine synthase (glutamine-hydrolysing)
VACGDIGPEHCGTISSGSRISRIGASCFLTRQFWDFYHYLPTILNSNDRMSMAASVEARVPFLENGMMDLGFHLAPGSKYRRRTGGKRVVKAAAEGAVPPDIIHAKKVGFAVPDTLMAGWDALLPGGIVPDLFKWGAAELDHLTSTLRRHWGLLGRRVVTMELWAQLHLNRRTPEEMADRIRSLPRR